MKMLNFILAALFFFLFCLCFLKVYLVFDYKRNYIYLDEIQNKINFLSNQNTKLTVEISLIKSSPYIYEKALAIGMIEPRI